MVRMTRGRAWIAVLGVLLAGIVALNVVTLSLAASVGHIDQNIQALDQENSILRSRDAQKSGRGADPPRRGRRSGWRGRGRPGRLPAGRPRRRRDRRRAPGRGRRPTEAGMRMIERRIGLLFAGFLLCFLVIVGRAFWLQGVQGAQLASEAAYQQTDVVTVPGLRGSVLDRYGNPLAASEDAATIYATPYQVKNPPRDGGETGLDPRPRARRRAEEPHRGLGLLLRRPQGGRADRGAGSNASSWQGSASCRTAAAPIRRATWRRR